MVGYNVKNENYPYFLKWILFDRFMNIKQIDKGVFAKVYTTI